MMRTPTSRKESTDQDLNSIPVFLCGVEHSEAASFNQSTDGFFKLHEQHVGRRQQYDGLLDIQQAGRIVCVGSPHPFESMAVLARRLVRTRSSVDLVDDFETAVEVISLTLGKWKLLVVDFDHAERQVDVEDIFGNLIAVREDRSSCEIALVAAGFASDDGSLIGSSIADHYFIATAPDERRLETRPQFLTITNRPSGVRRRCRKQRVRYHFSERRSHEFAYPSTKAHKYAAPVFKWPLRSACNTYRTNLPFTTHGSAPWRVAAALRAPRRSADWSSSTLSIIEGGRAGACLPDQAAHCIEHVSIATKIRIQKTTREPSTVNIYGLKSYGQGVQLAACIGAALILSACGGGGNVSAFFADRGNQVFNADTPSEVQVLSRATEFDRDQGISTRGRAEVIYSSASGNGADRGDRAALVADALQRAVAVSGCQQAMHTHSQNSIRGTHVMVALSACPPLSKRRF